MPDPQLILLQDLDGFTPHISRLVGMMNYARFTTLGAVHGLTVEQLDERVDDEANTIGMLLAHMAAIEVAYQVISFEDRWFTPEEAERWGPAMDLGEAGHAAIRGRDLASYLADLATVRERTLEGLRQRDDAWLAADRPFWWARGNPHFMWFHVVEDEINHRGQIRMIRRRLRKAEPVA